MGSEYLGPFPDPNEPPRAAPTHDEQQYEPAYREHVTGPLRVPPTYAPPPVAPPQGQQRQQMPQAPQQGAAYPPYAPPYGYPPQGAYPYGNGYAPYPPYPQYYGYPGYPNYPGYPGYPPYYYYPPQPTGPKRDGYLFGISLTSFICSILVLLGGLVCFLLLLVTSVVPTSSKLSGAQFFSSYVLFTALGVAGVVGGAFSLYHSIRSLFLKKPSAPFKLPWFWLFLALYVIVLVIAAIMRATNQAVADIPLTIFLITLAGILPALTILAIAVRRVHFPRSAAWPTTWRRFTLAVVSGATLAIMLASIFELILTVVVARGLGVSAISLDNPNQSIPQNPAMIGFLVILVSVIAPLVEEAVKPLAVVILIGRVRSAAEAFILGLSCGIGFDLIETSGYISMGYKDWLDVALQRSTAGLLHGLGAAMVALGWYYLTHPKESRHRFLLPLGCWLYAVLQHAIWNGSFGLQLLPAPIGPYLNNGSITLGTFSFPSFTLVYVIESALMLAFLFYMTRKVRPKIPTKPTPDTKAPTSTGQQLMHIK